MISRVSHVTIFVNDLEKAKEFFTAKLGFAVHTDAIMADGQRWLTLNPREQKDFEVTLMLGTNPNQYVPVLCLETDNCKKDFAELSAKGVAFMGEPKEEPWGTGVVFADPFGNMYYMNEPKAF